ncbi:MAG TPA: gluconokinase, GntK/IdnK-type [Saprospiraceae bacterium]|nr:gluconokinase, GntK/IdnK-type [Saprospiraceae bacterium]
MHIVVWIMGVTGSGKTTLGEALARETGWIFFDGDDFHPSSNIKKMSKGISLNDSDRLPWLETIHSLVKLQLQKSSVIIACSALRESYRQLLMAGIENRSFWILLNGDMNIIKERMDNRIGHYMPSVLLPSQISQLEKPEYGMEVDINFPMEEIVRRIKNKLYE